MTPFRERNPVIIGAVGIITLLAVFLLAFNADKLPLIGGGTTYAADFTDLSGLNKGDDVRVAGVKVGKVTGVSLSHGYVRVKFEVKGADLGDETRAAIRIKTLLGQKFLALDPAGAGSLSTKTDIPLDRTTTPFDVPAAFQGLASTVQQVDTRQLARAFDTLSTTFHSSPTSVRSALTGLSRLAHTIDSRDVALHDLLAHADHVTGVLASRDVQVRSLIDDGDLLLQVVHQRRVAIHRLLINTSVLAHQLIGLVNDNQAQLHPTLRHLHQVVAILKKNQTNLDKGLQVLAPFVRDFSNTLGNGRWFDTVVFDLPPQHIKTCTGPGCFIKPKGTS